MYIFVALHWTTLSKSESLPQMLANPLQMTCFCKDKNGRPIIATPQLNPVPWCHLSPAGLGNLIGIE